MMGYGYSVCPVIWKALFREIRDRGLQARDYREGRVNYLSMPCIHPMVET